MRINFRIQLIIVGLFIFSIVSAQNLKLGELFNEGAVLQRNTKVTVWGTTAPSSNVSVSIQGKVVQSKSDKTGNWTVDFSALKEGGPYEMTVSSANETIKLKEIYVGEVWIAGGQSNMGFMLQTAVGGKEEAANASNKNIRFVMVPYKPYEGYKTKGDMNWHTATSENNVASMSAVGYYFAKDLQQKLNVPVGIICCNKGGSGAETWMTRDWLLKSPETAPIVEKYESYLSDLGKQKYVELFSKYEADTKQYRDSVKNGNTKVIAPKEPMGERHFNRPYGLYHTMLERCIPYSIKGAIWYQGEHNSGRAEQYRTLFPALIAEWRNDFNNPDMPFLFVQLANYGKADVSNRPIWPELREAQLLTWQKVQHTGMAVTIDIGEKDNIHPPRKEQLGKRLAAIAFKNVYSIKTPYSGPVYKSMEIKGNQAILTFDFVYNGLKVDGELKGFSICGTDKNFIPAKAEIKGNQIVVYSELISKPIAVRYGWANWTEANLFNSADLPATPFRTDDFSMLTAGKKSDSYK
jgi:sialate O-acetylesterase